MNLILRAFAVETSVYSDTGGQCHLVLRSRSMPAPYFRHSLALQEGHDHKTLTNFSKSLPVLCFCRISTPHVLHFSDSGTGTAFMPVFTGADLYR